MQGTHGIDDNVHEPAAACQQAVSEDRRNISGSNRLCGVLAELLPRFAIEALLVVEKMDRKYAPCRMQAIWISTCRLRRLTVAGSRTFHIPVRCVITPPLKVKLENPTCVGASIFFSVDCQPHGQKSGTDVESLPSHFQSLRFCDFI